jgi:hypothetical protein
MVVLNYHITNIGPEVAPKKAVLGSIPIFPARAKRCGNLGIKVKNIYFA